MARFIRDEKRTYPLWWLVAGSLFAGSTVWAVYAELVTRVPWEKQQEAFYEMELQQSTQALAAANAHWKDVVEPSIKAKLDRKAELEKSQTQGEYATKKARLAQLDRIFADAEQEKTFGGSDLDEAYYFRQEAEYERDKQMNEVRAMYREHFAGEEGSPQKGDDACDAMFANPTPGPKPEGESDKLYKLHVEIERLQTHKKHIGEALPKAPTPAIGKELGVVLHDIDEVIGQLEKEVTYQTKVDKALAEMAKAEGPADPPLSERDPVKRAEEQSRARAAVCKGNEDTRNCIKWLSLEPIDLEVKAIDVDVSKAKRFLSDAQLRTDKAKKKAKAGFDLDNIIQSIVGPFQIQQVVLNWMDYERDVDKEQVDRCQTCHMGAAAGIYTDASIPRQFRTHPWRSTLMTAHPVEKFGCTSCHQGQGRATDKLAHSGWHLEEVDGVERWHFAGDHYWEDPLLPIGSLNRIIVDDRDDQLSVKINKGSWTKISIPHRSPDAHDKDATVPASYHVEENEHGHGAEEGTHLTDEALFFGAIQGKIQAAVDADAAVKAKWHAVVRKLDNRVQIGLEANDPTATFTAKERPSLYVKFDKPELATTLGFVGVAETDPEAKEQLFTASSPPSVPVRGAGEAHFDKSGRYHPPRGAEGAQIDDEMRNRFIQALPEVESSCLRCHANDVDLKPRTSHARYVTAKLEREKAEAWLKKDPAGYKKAHDGSDDLPAPAADPAEAMNPVPTFSEGRHLFKKLNCTGCHILDGFAWDRNTGPELDNITSKVSPEWVLEWIRYPRGWRAKTRMPALWPKPLDPASKRPVPAGTPEYEKWKSAMREETVDIASFLVERSDNPGARPGMPKDARPLKETVKGYADVPGATAEKGKVIFESYGCQACHATSDVDLPEPWKSRERDIAPTLANMGGKTTADWVAYWVEQPNRYWHGTKMPNLRLSHDEAASVGKYIASLKSKPLDAAEVEKTDAAIVNDPAKRNERVPCSNAGGQIMSRVECGEKLIGYYGCFGCHNITGFEKSAPIAPELGSFAKKDLTTLDFGYAIPDHHLQTTETFATLKLDAPRIYRRDRIELRMADFDLSPREIRALVVFLKGLTSGKPRNAYAPSQHEEYAAALEGREIVDNYNCRGCHVIENHGADIDAVRQGQLGADIQARAPWLNGEGMRVQPEWLFGFLRDPGKNGIRPWLHPEWAYAPGPVPDDKLALRMPTFNFNEDQVTAVVRYFASWDGQEYPYEAVKANPLSEMQKRYALTHMMSTEDANCLSCHYQGEFPKQRGLDELGKLAPNLNNVARRLRPEWVKEWLLRPQNWLPYTKMTAFWATSDRPKDAGLWATEQDPFISKTPVWTKAPGPEGVTSEMQAEMVRDFLFGLAPDAVFPATIDDVADSPLVKNAPAAEAKAEADTGKDKDKKDKDKKDKKDKDKKKKVGAIQGPARF